MISKNTEHVKIRVTNEQSAGNERDTISEDAAGTLRRSGGKWYISYKPEGCVCMIKTEGDTVFMKRTGEYGSEMMFVPGEKRDFTYRTPFGEIAMELFTEHTEYEITEDGGFISLRYSIEQNGDKIYNNTVITIER